MLKKFLRRGFTLIELLIVVAIIAILAAIAVPNFLDAQIRSKVSRVKADMRAIATAVEAYCVDNNAYPYPDNGNGVAEDPPVSDGFENHVPTRITTPISYMTSLPSEPFKEKVILDENTQYNYCDRAYFLLAGAETEFNEYVDYLIGLSPATQYYILSHGPDLDHDDPDEGNPALYDPTNGTTSNGDILYWGPGIGYRQ